MTTAAVLAQGLLVNSVPMEWAGEVIANITKLFWIQLLPQHSPITPGAMGPWGSHWLILPLNCSWNSPTSHHPGPWGACLVAVCQLKILVCSLQAQGDWLPCSETVTCCGVTTPGKNSYHKASWDGDPMHWLFWGNTHTLIPWLTPRSCSTCMEGSVSLSFLTEDDRWSSPHNAPTLLQGTFPVWPCRKRCVAGGR